MPLARYRAWTCNSPLFLGGSGPTCIDLLKAIKLEDVVFRPGSLSVHWIAMAPLTITPKHRDLQQISICVCYRFILARTDPDVGQTIGEQIRGEWSDLDHLFQFWESCSIHPRVVCPTLEEDTPGMRDSI